MVVVLVGFVVGFVLPTHGRHPLIHGDEERIDIHFFLEEGDLGRDRINLVLGGFLESQQFGYLREGLSVEHGQVFSLNRACPAGGGGLDLVVSVEVGLCGQVELRCTFESAQHGQ